MKMSNNIAGTIFTLAILVGCLGGCSMRSHERIRMREIAVQRSYHLTHEHPHDHEKPPEKIAIDFTMNGPDGTPSYTWFKTVKLPRREAGMPLSPPVSDAPISTLRDIMVRQKAARE